MRQTKLNFSQEQSYIEKLNKKCQWNVSSSQFCTLWLNCQCFFFKCFLPFIIPSKNKNKNPLHSDSCGVFALLKWTKLTLLTSIMLLAAEAQTSLALAQEKERAATEKLTEVSSRCTALEASNTQMRQEKALLSAQLESNRHRMEMLEDHRARQACAILLMKSKFG